MVEGLEVTIKYRGAKYNQVATPATASSEFAILKKDLAHLRVHSPSQKNVRRVNGSFILHWPTAGASPKLDGLADSLHTRWFKLCSDDPEALKLREFLSIESITLMQDGVLIRSTAQRDQASQDALSERLNDSSSRPGQQPALTSVPMHPLPTKPSLSLPPPPRVPPIGPRSDRQLAPHLKRRMSSHEGPSASPIRQKLDIPDTQSTSSGPRSTNSPAHPTRTLTSPKIDLPQRRSTTPKDAPRPSPQSAREDRQPTPSQPPQPVMPPPREPGETTPRTPVVASPLMTTLGWGSMPPPPAPPSPAMLSGPVPAPPFETAAVPVPMSMSASPTVPVAPIPPSPNQSDVVAQLMRQLMDTRNALVIGQKEEQALLDRLERLGVPAESYPGGSGNGESGGGRRDRNGAEAALRDEVARLENEIKAERVRRMRAERALSDVERECKAPFVVPALYQAFITISELAN